MPDLIRFSDLSETHPLALDGSNDLLAIAHPNISSETGYSSMTTTPNQLSAFAVEDATFANLKTTNKTVRNAINETISNFADDYDDTSTYDLNDCVLYAGTLYKCTTAIAVAEAWNSAHWTAIKAVDVGGGASWTDVTGTLTAGSTTITLSDASITTSSTIDVYTDTFGINPTAMTVSTGSVTLTFESQANNLGVKVRVS